MMDIAIQEAKRKQTPFGAVITMGEEVIVTAANTTGEDHDPTAHAEINALRELGDLTRKRHFPGYTLYTTGEPCPMCSAAACWSRIGSIYYGASIDAISQVMPQILLPSTTVIEKSGLDIPITGGLLEDECLELLSLFA